MALAGGRDVGPDPVVVRNAGVAFEGIGRLRDRDQRQNEREHQELSRNAWTFLWKTKSGSAFPLLSVKL
jgi:hypothetical protein